MKNTNFPEFLKISNSDLSSEFRQIAEILCNYYCISANEIHYDIIEVEFYYDSKEHPDKFIYKKINDVDINQNLSIGNWLFHYSGIDLTFGQGGTRGGILIRGIKNGSRRIVGPLKTMMELLNHMYPVEKEGNLNLQLIKRPTPTNFELDSSPRFGLNKKEEGAKDPFRFTVVIK